ncbi:MAG: hypothetical protein HY821_19910 [Acidobacteria bacterium]|nr:hypothetical protein [Acidobacteriota bacterium]
MKSRIFQSMAAGAALACAVMAASSAPQSRAPLSGGSRAAGFDRYETGIAAWIWSDKIWYSPGERMTLKWTVKSYGEQYPVTVVAYWQNNETGAKTYAPKGSSEVTDILGNAADSFQVIPLADTEKGVLVGDGGLLPWNFGAVPEAPGMHTVVVEIRDSTGGRILKTLYQKVSIVKDFVDVTGNIESDTTWTPDKLYRLSGVVYVRNNATLTIKPGTLVMGQPGSQPPSVLVVTRNGKIMAEGTRSRPIIMTSALNPGERTRGDWGGLIMLGKAPINVAPQAGKGNENGEFFIEGLPATEDTKYGGADAAHSCGSLKYVRVEYAGSIFAPNNESNSFTWGGCGTGTKADYLQAIYGLDDSFEWFGGTMGAKHLIGGLGADDYLDFQLGFTGKIQHGIFYYSADSKGNRGIEGDNSEYDQAATPLSNPTMFNLTFVGGGEPGFDEANAPGIYLRRGSAGSFNNILVTNFYSAGAFIDGTATQEQVNAGKLTMNGILLWNNNLGKGGGTTLDSQVDAGMLDFAQGKRGSGKNFVAADPKLRRPFEYSDPDFRALPGSPVFLAMWIQPPDDGFFDQSSRYLGGAAEEAWWEEWTSFLQDADIKK